MNDRPIPTEKMHTIVENVPVVSVDLVVEYEGGVLLGKRENEPARGEWFVPGGTVMKNERRAEAVQRVAREELGAPVVIDERLGVHEHFYDTSEFPDIDSKHYLATAYRCHFEPDSPDPVEDDQHSALRAFTPPFGDFHPYVERYLDAL